MREPLLIDGVAVVEGDSVVIPLDDLDAFNQQINQQINLMIVQPNNLIAAMQKDFNMEELFRGRYTEFNRFLRRIYPHAETYCDCNYVITKINGKFYDYTGEVQPGLHIAASGGCGHCEV